MMNNIEIMEDQRRIQAIIPKKKYEFKGIFVLVYVY